MAVKRRRRTTRKTTVKRTSARRCSCSVGALRRVVKRKKTTRSAGATCKIIRIKGRGVRKLCRNANGQYRFRKMSA